MIHGCLTATIFHGGYWIVSIIYGEVHAEEHKGMQFLWSMLLLGWFGAICAVIAILANRSKALVSKDDYLGLALAVLFVIALPAAVFALKGKQEKKIQNIIDSALLNQQPAKKWSGLSEISSVPTTQGITRSAIDQHTENTSIDREEPKPLFCRKCGAKLSGEGMCCRICGAQIQFSEIPTERNNTEIGIKAEEDPFPNAEIEIAQQDKSPEQENGPVVEEKPEIPNYDDLLLDRKKLPPLLRRAFLFLEDEEYARADEYIERVLDQNPECFEAYLGKAMCQNKCNSVNELAGKHMSIKENKDLRRAVQFVDGGKKEMMYKLFSK